MKKSKEKNSAKSAGSGRTRNYVSILYPESAVDGWMDILRSFAIPCVISPLHDKDLQLETVVKIDQDGFEVEEAWAEVTKKPHYHIMLCFDNVKTKAQAQAVFDAIGAIKCLAVSSLRGQARYFCHLDDKSKYQYPITDVVTIGGVDYLEMILMPADDLKALAEMTSFIDQYQIYSFKLFADICKTYHEDWWAIITRRATVFIREYIKSAKYTFEHPESNPNQIQLVDGKLLTSDGEIIECM